MLDKESINALRNLIQSSDTPKTNVVWTPDGLCTVTDGKIIEVEPHELDEDRNNNTPHRWQDNMKTVKKTSERVEEPTGDIRAEAKEAQDMLIAARAEMDAFVAKQTAKIAALEQNAFRLAKLARKTPR